LLKLYVKTTNILGKVIQKNQLDATMIYGSIRSAQHVSSNILPIIRSVRLRYLQHVVSWKDGCTEKLCSFVCDMS